MNREQRRLLQKQGAVDETGSPVLTAPTRSPRTSKATISREIQKRSVFEAIRQYFVEVRAELRKVAWPTPAEVRGYATVVMVSLLVLGLLIFGIDYGCNQAVQFLFG